MWQASSGYHLKTSASILLEAHIKMFYWALVANKDANSFWPIGNPKFR
jgi:hypothetical protein